MIKQSFRYLCLALLTLSPALASAQKKAKVRRVIPAAKLTPAKPAVKIIGTVTAEEEGQMVYLLRQGAEGVDTLALAPVKDNAFTFESSAVPVDTLGQAMLRYGKQGLAIILEPGTIVVDMDQKTVGGATLNTRLKNFNTKLNEEFQPLLAKYREAEGEAKEAAYLLAVGHLRKAYDGLYRSNIHNALGVSALAQLMGGQVGLSPEEIRPYLDLATPQMLAVPQIAKAVKSLEAVLATSAGKPYVDVEGINDEEQPSKLSDFVAKGHYTLVDFWASWCGPCRRAMPGLKRIYDKYGKDGLQIVGLAVWDKWDAHLKAVSDLGLPWPQIFNEQATEPYGVKGIPQIMLIAPDGTIVARDLHGEEKISELLEAEKAKNGGKL